LRTADFQIEELHQIALFVPDLTYHISAQKREPLSASLVSTSLEQQAPGMDLLAQFHTLKASH
jgi:hypothetical protein